MNVEFDQNDDLDSHKQILNTSSRAVDWKPGGPVDIWRRPEIRQKTTPSVSTDEIGSALGTATEIDSSTDASSLSTSEVIQPRAAFSSDELKKLTFPHGIVQSREAIAKSKAITSSPPVTPKLEDGKEEIEAHAGNPFIPSPNKIAGTAGLKRAKQPRKSPFFPTPSSLGNPKKRKDSFLVLEESVTFEVLSQEQEVTPSHEGKSKTKKRQKVSKSEDRYVNLEEMTYSRSSPKKKRNQTATADSLCDNETSRDEQHDHCPPSGPEQTPKGTRHTIYTSNDELEQEKSEEKPLDLVSEDQKSESPDRKHKKPKFVTKSPFFPVAKAGDKEKKKPRPKGGTLSCIPFPPLSENHFGLIQEKLASSPYELLLAVTFLIRTKGRDAIPVFFQLLDRYPTKEVLAAANVKDIIPMIHHLGLQVQRANSYIKYAKMFIEEPPVKGCRYRVENYPTKGAHVGIAKDEILEDADERTGAWEIGHMTKGHYAIDSWRMFCRDILRGEAQGYNGEGRGPDFEPEWKRVVPLEKELRAWMRWSWLKEGREYDIETGETKPADEEVLKAAREGRIAWDDLGGMRIFDNDRGDDVEDPNERGNQ